ncbi:LacI family DNA-binding transcriptional regulator [Kalamiella sp. sgz302252]|uniref:LacI family DNA-binding transcriptional regulator n=1 Tax=Pantoea sp. sgz302252 TaxID=3341827 RepID=UPI0036D29888
MSGNSPKTPPSSTVPRAPTLQDVARHAGLSPMTVSRALNRPQLVRAATLAKVMAAVQATGYIPNLLAGGLASNRSRLIAVVVPQINNNMFTDTIQAISDELAARGYHMLLCVAGYEPEEEEAIVSALLSRKPDGIVLTGIHHTKALKKRLLNAALPVVEIWDLTPTPLDMLIGFSHEKAGYAAGEYIAAKGYSRVGLLWTDDNRAQLRRQGALAALEKSGLKCCCQTTVPLPATMAAGRKGMADLLTSQPDAIICSSDTLAQGAMLQAQSCGLKVPDDIAVIGFGDLDFASSMLPPLTTIAIDRWETGKLAAIMLTDKIAGGEPANTVVDLGFSLILRHST